MDHMTRREFLANTAAIASASTFLANAEAAQGEQAAVKPRRSCYINFAEHLLNAYNPNMLYPGLPHRWSDEDWHHFIDMIGDFGFSHFEFWLVPRMFSRAGLKEPYGEAFARQINSIIEHGKKRHVGVKLLTALTTVGDDWHTHCPNVPEEWEEVLMLWDEWTRRLPGLSVVGIFPGDPGGCSRNGCDGRTYIDSSLKVAEIIKKNQPQAEIEIGTWGTPFWGWGTIEGPPGWKGEFIPSIQHTAWKFDKKRADESMQYFLKRLKDFPADTSVAINLAFNGDGNPDVEGGSMDARGWAREISKTNRILTWDFSLTEGENAILPHYRFERLYAQRKRELEAANYCGGICFTMTPLLNQLSLFQSAQSFQNPQANPEELSRTFYRRLFGAEAERLTELLPLFELIPDWGNYNKIDMPQGEYHARMKEGADLLHSLKDKGDASIPFHPNVEAYRKSLLYFFEFFAGLTSPSPDFAALQKGYWESVYKIYDSLPEHVDPRPRSATERLVRFFDKSWNGQRLGEMPSRWNEPWPSEK